MDFYIQHNNEVRNFFTFSDRFIELSWDSGDGWEKLCHFLDEDLPNCSFPRANTSQQQSHQKIIERLCNENRPAAAIQYAKSQPNPEQLMNSISETFYSQPQKHTFQQHFNLSTACRRVARLLSFRIKNRRANP